MNIKKEILLLVEEEELDTPEKLKLAVERGRVPGVKPSDKIYKNEYKKFITLFKDFPSIYKNAAIKLALKKLLTKKDDISSIKVDAYHAYFSNRNKKEAKTTYNQLFTDFEEGKISDYNFEKKVNKLFKEKSVGKEEANKLYEDDNWLVVIPKSFTASCKYGEGTKWCTTSQKSMFERYNKQSPLIIIINKKQDSITNPLAKVQFHSKTGSAMDAKDEKINVEKYLGSLPEKIQEILKTQGFNKWDYVLEDAVKSGNIKQVKEALDKGANIHANNEGALRWASFNGHTEIVKILLDKGANIHAKDALQWAAQKGHAEVVTLLLKAGADIHAGDALRLAAESGHAEVVTLLLKAGADIHARDDYALRWAAEKGHTEVVTLLLNKGADIHADNDIALQWAAQKGHVEVVTLLLNKGADIHAGNDYALRWAAQNGHTEIVTLLLKAGADIHAKDDKALQWAADKGHTEVVKLLKQYMKKGK